jgi:hypothetical protein
MGMNALLAILAFLIVSAPHPAWAYLDPGSGSMLLQVLLGGIAGAVVLVRIYWRRLMAFLGLAKPAASAVEVVDETGEQNSDPS